MIRGLGAMVVGFGVVLAGCGGGPSCEDAVGNAMKRVGMGGATYGKPLAESVAVCRDQKWSARVRTCLAAATTAAAVESCVTREQAAERAPPAARGGHGKKDRTEADINLKAIEKASKIYYIEQGEFPVVTAAATPARPCCEGPDHKCQPGPTVWRGVPAWDTLDFDLIEPHFYQYAYESDGKTVTARAIADLDCDGTTIEYVLRGAAVDGNPRFELSRPTTSD